MKKGDKVLLVQCSSSLHNGGLSLPLNCRSFLTAMNTIAFQTRMLGPYTADNPDQDQVSHELARHVVSWPECSHTTFRLRLVSRPYSGISISSHPNTEIKLLWARIVRLWGTRLEVRVLWFSFFFFLFCFVGNRLKGRVMWFSFVIVDVRLTGQQCT